MKYEYENFYSAPEKITKDDVLAGISFIIGLPLFVYLMCLVFATN